MALPVTTMPKVLSKKTTFILFDYSITAFLHEDGIWDRTLIRKIMSETCARIENEKEKHPNSITITPEDTEEEKTIDSSFILYSI